MQITSRFTVALHIFACMVCFQDKMKVTSEVLAGSTNTHPVIIRRLLSRLKSAGLILVARGTGGISPARPLESISFLDIYRAVEPIENGDLFRFHESPNPECPVGRNIHALIDSKLLEAQRALEAELEKHSAAELKAGLNTLLEKEREEFSAPKPV